MKEIKVTVNGQKVPCRMTMGALMAYKDKTGRDVSEIKTTDTAEVVRLVVCCIESACRADGVRLEGVDMGHLADYIDIGELAGTTDALLGGDAGNVSGPAAGQQI